MGGAQIWGELAAAWTVFGLNVLSPGPNVLNTMAVSIAFGRAHGFAAAAAVALGVFWWSALALVGAAALFAAWPGAQAALSVLGGGLLLWFGARYLRRALAMARGGGPTSATSETPALARGAVFRQALAIQMANPKAMTTWLVLLALFPVAEAGPGPTLALAVGAVAVALIGHLGYAVIFSTRTAERAYARAAPLIIGGVGVFFISLGAGLLWEAWLGLAPAA